jgi:NADPH:quinone reductase-like Zn-dependent oxidoreductase
MRVIEVGRFGGPKVLVPVDVDDQVPGPGEIVVDVAAAADRIRPVIGATFPLDKAADAHAALESRSVVGKMLLIP